MSVAVSAFAGNSAGFDAQVDRQFDPHRHYQRPIVAGIFRVFRFAGYGKGLAQLRGLKCVGAVDDHL